MSVETKPNKLTKGLVLDTFHTDVDNTVATYALNAQLEDQEGNHFHYGSEVGTTFIKNIPDNHVVIGHVNMERNETVLFTTDGTNSTIGILSRNDDMSYNYEIKVDDSKQEKKLNFKKNTYIRGVYRLLNGCDKVIYFVDGINKDRRINLNQLNSYKLPTTASVASGIIFDDSLRATVFALSSATGNIQLIRLLSANPEATANVLANLSVGDSLTKLLEVSANGIGTAFANLIRTANIVSSIEATGTSTVNVDIVRLLQSNVSAIGSVNAILESTQQGVVEIDVTLSGVALSTATLLRAALLETNVTAQATTIVDTIVTKIIDAQVQALANTESSAQISIPISATVNAIANTTASAILSSIINATVNATVDTSATVQLSKVISTSVDALANSSSEALIGLVLVSTNIASASTSTINLIIGNSLTASVTAQGTTTAELIIAELLSSTMTATANTTANSLVSKLLSSTVSSLATTTSSLQLADVLTSSVSGAATVSATLTSADADADAAAFFARVTTAGGTLTSTEQSAVDTLVKSLKSNGIWSKMIAIYPVVGASAAACAQNLKSSSFTGTFTGCTFASTGVTPNGTSGFMDTNCNPNLFTSWHKSIYSRTTNTTGRDMGIDAYDLILSLGGTIYSRFGSSNVVTSNADSKGFYISTEAPTLSHKLFKNGSQLGSTESFNGIYPNYKIFIGAISDANVANYFSSRQFAFASIGDGLTDTEAGNLNTAVQAFQTSLSRNV